MFLFTPKQRFSKNTLVCGLQLGAPGVWVTVYNVSHLCIKKHLRADVSKYRPEAYKSEKLKNPKKIHRVALVNLLSEIYFLFRFDDYY